MSNQQPLRGIVVGHGLLASGLVDAVRKICGSEADSLVALDNTGMTADRLAEIIREATNNGPGIVFTDLIGGSCGFVAGRLCRDVPNLAVMGGVNLPLLLDFVHHRNLPLPELLPRLLQRGRAGICCVPMPDQEDNADSPSQG